MDSTKTLTVDVINARRILRFCPYYDDIINYDIRYDDEFSFDLIDWYKDLIFSCDGNNDNEMNIVRLIDKSMYLYINSYEYRNGLKKKNFKNLTLQQLRLQILKSQCLMIYIC